jgi:hypothetical protein
MLPLREYLLGIFVAHRRILVSLRIASLFRTIEMCDLLSRSGIDIHLYRKIYLQSL